ncbi:MAG: hypothetical protein MR673_04660 [Fusobacterium perfoetens]|uniref:hypothetical protein n=1 Tax=Fusobacterium perfoetens TaxID=852 RepID=UPI0023F2F0D4|nr:hypothetical protein [Fusobacterium perfoetens]MCI6152406.1 hypothetical protein [Fusobacterium perfoetens]MDY3237005.1 hypothetical protein [Fusobacterium perfoetens]
MLPFILLTLYKLYIDDNILLSYYLLLLVMFIVIIGYLFYKKNKKLKTSFFIISLNFIFIIFIEYQKDYRVSKNINYIIPIEKFEKDRNFFNNKNIILIEKNGIVKTSRFRIKFNGVAHKVLYNRTNFNFLHKNIYENYYRIKRYDYLISKYYEAGKLKYNIVHFYEFNTIDKLKFLTFLAIRNNNFDKNKYDKIVTYNKNFEEEFNSFIFSYEKKADFYILNNKFLLPLKENLDIYDTNEIIKIVQKMIYSSKK